MMSKAGGRYTRLHGHFSRGLWTKQLGKLLSVTGSANFSRLVAAQRGVEMLGLSGSILAVELPSRVIQRRACWQLSRRTRSKNTWHLMTPHTWGSVTTEYSCQNRQPHPRDSLKITFRICDAKIDSPQPY